jgi:hypothetical protein
MKYLTLCVLLIISASCAHHNKRGLSSDVAPTYAGISERLKDLNQETDFIIERIRTNGALAFEQAGELTLDIQKEVIALADTFLALDQKSKYPRCGHDFSEERLRGVDRFSIAVNRIGLLKMMAQENDRKDLENTMDKNFHSLSKKLPRMIWKDFQPAKR